MLNVYYTKKMGELILMQDGKEFKIYIYGANALCAFIYEYEKEGKTMAQLWNFFGDITHMRRCLGLVKGYNATIHPSEVKNLRLNMAYEECPKMLKVFVKAGFEVTAYYEPIEK